MTIAFRGTGTVTVTVVGARRRRRAFPAPASSSGQRRAGRGSPAVRLPRRQAGSPTDPARSSFANIPVGAFSVTADAAALAGVSNGAIGAPGATVATDGAAGRVRHPIAGRVLLPDGHTPAAQAIVTLRFTPQSGFRRGVLQSRPV